MDMHRNLKRAWVFGVVAILAACASTPETNPMLDDAMAGYKRATADAQVVRSAPVDLQKAQRALQQAEAALRAGEQTTTVEHFAYLAKSRTATAIESAKIAAAEEAVSAASVQRERILMEIRTREADTQRKQAQMSLAEADAARVQAEAARNQAEQQLAQAQAQRAAALASDERAKRLTAQLEEMKAKQTERGIVLTLGDVLFDSGRADMKPGALKTLEQLAAFLQENPERNVVIEGHTDSVGSAEFNQALSERRALTVKNALIERNISSNRITARGFGPSKPLVSNDSAAGRQQNRRVEIVLPGAS